MGVAVVGKERGSEERREWEGWGCILGEVRARRGGGRGNVHVDEQGMCIPCLSKSYGQVFPQHLRISLPVFNVV